MERLKDNLRRIRRLRGLQQSEVSAALGMTRAAYTNYENGIRRPKLDILLRIARLYQVSVDTLLGSGLEEMGALNPQEQFFMEQYRLLRPDAQAHFLKLVSLEAELERKRSV